MNTLTRTAAKNVEDLITQIKVVLMKTSVGLTGNN
jgi:hypothetical protein